MSRDPVRAALAEHAALVERVAREMVGSIEAMAEAVLAALRGGGRVLLCGNGGSAADAQHLAAELVVRFGEERGPLPAIALVADTAVLTASANDLGFERVFERQVNALGQEGDLVILLSTKGESENLLAAARAARERGIKTVGLLGGEGGRLAGLVDLALVVPTGSTARAQEIHLVIGHIVCEIVDRAFAPAGDGPDAHDPDVVPTRKARVEER